MGLTEKAPHHRVGLAAAWRPSLQGEASQVARSWQDGNLTIAAVAGAGDCGWSVWFPLGSALLLDMAAQAWRESSGAPGLRLHTAATGIEQKYPEALCKLVPDDGDAYKTVGAPFGSLVIAVASEAQIWIAWLGGEGASLVHNSAVIERTTPHTLKASAKGTMDATHVAVLPDVCIRALSIDTVDRRLEHVTGAWAAQPGDRLVLLSREAQRLVTRDDLASACTTEADSPSLASRLVGEAMQRDAVSAAAVVVHWPSSAAVP